MMSRHLITIPIRLFTKMKTNNPYRSITLSNYLSNMYPCLLVIGRGCYGNFNLEELKKNYLSFLPEFIPVRNIAYDMPETTHLRCGPLHIFNL